MIADCSDETPDVNSLLLQASTIRASICVAFHFGSVGFAYLGNIQAAPGTSMVDQEEHQQPAKAKKGTTGKKGTTNNKATSAKKGAGASGTPSAAQQRKGPSDRQPAKLSFKQKQAVDYVRTATRHNVWYYRDR